MQFEVNGKKHWVLHEGKGYFWRNEDLDRSIAHFSTEADAQQHAINESGKEYYEEQRNELTTESWR